MLAKVRSMLIVKIFLFRILPVGTAKFDTFHRVTRIRQNDFFFMLRCVTVGMLWSSFVQEFRRCYLNF